MGKVEELLNSVDAIIWEWDVQEKRYTFVSQQAERILGYPLFSVADRKRVLAHSPSPRR